MSLPPDAKHLFRWFDPRRRSISTLGFILNRVTALGLTVYLFIHLIALGNLARGEQAYQMFLSFAHHPLVKLGELLVVAGGLIHGLNGIRLFLISFGFGVRWQRPILMILLLISIAFTAFFAIRMF